MSFSRSIPAESYDGCAPGTFISNAVESLFFVGESMFLNSVGHPYLLIDIPPPSTDNIKILILILPSGFAIRTETNCLTFFVGHREQINRLTSFIDGGTLYGDSLLSHALLNAPNGRCKINAHY